MAQNNFAACDAFTAQSEGGFTKNPNDPGNWTGNAVGVGTLLGTNYGIAAGSHPGVDPSKLTPADAAAIRQRWYWQPVQGDDLPIGIDLMIYDQAVNSGPARSSMILQGVLGVVQDGQIGPRTMAALHGKDLVQLITSLTGAQSAFYGRLPTFQEFGEGWLKRVTERAAKALKMVG